MESNQSFVDNMIQWMDRLDDMFPPDRNREDVYTLLRFYIMMDKLKTVVKRSGLVLFNRNCGPSCGCVGCDNITMGERKVLPPNLGESHDNKGVC